MRICGVFIAVFGRQLLIMVGHNKPSLKAKKSLNAYRSFSRGPKQRNSDILVDQNNPRAIELHFYANISFFFNKCILAAGHVSDNHQYNVA